MKKFIVRNENFGATVYDSSKLKHFFISHDQTGEFINSEAVEKRNNIPFKDNKEIIFSPIRVYYELTLGCNLHCRTCLNNSGKVRKKELSFEQSIKLINGLKRDYVFDIRFTGGEPTQKFGLETLMQTAKDAGLVVSLTSNGIFSQETLDKLVSVKPHETTISLDGFGASNDYIRGRGTFSRAVKSIQKLKENGCRVTINTLVTKLMTWHDVKKLLQFADVYCDDISFFHVRPIGRAIASKNQILSYNELYTFMEKIEELKDNYPNLEVRTRSSSISNNSIGKEQEKFGLMTGGPDGFTRINILSNGDIYAGGCVPYVNFAIQQKLKLGNIAKQNYSLLNIWRFSNKLKKIRKVSSNLKKRCDDCKDYKAKCSGFTLEMELYREIDPGHKNPYCKFGGLNNGRSLLR